MCSCFGCIALYSYLEYVCILVFCSCSRMKVKRPDQGSNPETSWWCRRPRSKSRFLLVIGRQLSALARLGASLHLPLLPSCLLPPKARHTSRHGCSFRSRAQAQTLRCSALRPACSCSDNATTPASPLDTKFAFGTPTEEGSTPAADMAHQESRGESHGSRSVREAHHPHGVRVC